MLHSGLVSVSFRDLPLEKVIMSSAQAGLKYIEWGSDVHAPYTNTERLAEIVKLQEKYGVTCCSYGTYFRLAVTPIEELAGYIRAAKMLGTDILRLWCGNKKSEDFTLQEKTFLFGQCKKAAAMAEEAGVMLCMECHRKSYTETKEGALELMQAVDSPAFRMYWQPNQMRTVDENVEYIRLLKDYITHIHVFQWKETLRFSLAEGIKEWKTYLREIPGDHMMLLEFMPDDKIESLPAEAKALFELTGEI